MSDFRGKTCDNIVLYDIPTPKKIVIKDEKHHKAARTTSFMKVRVHVMFTQMTR